MSKILIVEDNETLRIVLRDNLEEEGYTVAEARDGAEARRALAETQFDVIVLDIMLPDTNGYALCEHMRATGIRARVLMLTARTLEDDLVRGLDAGADDYLTKPYRLRELLARLRSLLRRPAQPEQGELLTCGPYQIDRSARTICHKDGYQPGLTPKEFDLLSFLLERDGKAVSRHEILDGVWGQDVIVDDRTVDNFVSNLKRKLRWTKDSGFKIHTVRGVGYRMEKRS